MKMTVEVLAALQVLRDNAENDFELHRIDVLERDLTNPPQVEIIDERHQQFEGVKYHKNRDGHYERTVSIHRMVWQYYHGNIPPKHDVHHENTIKDDNNPTNLQLLPKAEHMKLHEKSSLAKFRSNLKAFTCANCGKEFYSPDYKKIKFCSVKCSNAFNHKNRAFETRTCKRCGKEFLARIDSKTVFCSGECVALDRAARGREIRECVICGKSFETIKSSRNKTCCVECGRVLQWQTRKRKEVNL